MGYSGSLLHRNPKHIFEPKAENCSLCITLYDFYGLISIALLLCFCSFFFFLSLSGFLDIFDSFSTFYPHRSCFVVPFLGLFPPSSSNHLIINLSCIFLSFLSLLPEPALTSLLPLGQCCCCRLISLLRFTSAGLGCTGLAQHGHSAFARRFETG